MVAVKTAIRAFLDFILPVICTLPFEAIMPTKFSEQQ